MTYRNPNRLLIAFRLFTEVYPGQLLSADDLHKLLWEHELGCDIKTARFIWDTLSTAFVGSTNYSIKITIERRGSKRIPTRVMAILAKKE